MFYSAYGQPECFPFGDVDGDYDVDTADATALTALIGTLVSSDVNILADLNLDGLITQADLNLLNTNNYMNHSGGVNVLSVDSEASDVGYAGYVWDDEMASWHVRNRELSPRLGRWLQRDALGYIDSFQMYEYVQSNPLIFYDPVGTDTGPARERGFNNPETYHPYDRQKNPEQLRKALYSLCEKAGPCAKGGCTVAECKKEADIIVKRFKKGVKQAKNKARKIFMECSNTSGIIGDNLFPQPNPKPYKCFNITLAIYEPDYSLRTHAFIIVSHKCGPKQIWPWGHNTIILDPWGHNLWYPFWPQWPNYKYITPYWRWGVPLKDFPFTPLQPPSLPGPLEPNNPVIKPHPPQPVHYPPYVFPF